MRIYTAGCIICVVVILFYLSLAGQALGGVHMRENAYLRQASFAQTGLTRPCLEIMRDFTSSESRLFIWFLSFVQVLLRHRSYAADSDQMCRSKEEEKSVNVARNASVNLLIASLKCSFCSNRGGDSSTPRFCEALVPLVFRLFCRWA